MVEGENTGIAAEVCDVLEVQSGPSGHGCERARLLSAEVTSTRQNWAEQEKWRMCVCHSHSWIGFSKAEWKAAPRLEVSRQL